MAKENLELLWPLWGTCNLQNFFSSRLTYKATAPKLKQTKNRMGYLFNWHIEASKRFQTFKMVSLKDSLQSDNRK